MRDFQPVYRLPRLCVEPTVYDEVEKCVYEELWDTARMLTETEIKPYARSNSTTDGQRQVTKPTSAL